MQINPLPEDGDWWTSLPTLSHGSGMKHIYAVIELADDSAVNPSSDEHLDEIAEDLLTIAHRVRAVTVYPSYVELAEEGGRSALRAAEPGYDGAPVPAPPR